MTDRPIIFSAPMVRALLDGRKTQTRRLIRDALPTAAEIDGVVHEPCHGAPYLDAYCGEPRTPSNPRGMGVNWCWWTRDNRCGPQFRVGYMPGDRLWVREAHALLPRSAYRASIGTGTIAQQEHPSDAYSAAVFREGFDRSGRPQWRPSIHMPRWASRLMLTVTDVRVQRLQKISEEDARAEGVGSSGPFPGHEHDFDAPPTMGAVENFEALWNSLHGRDAWSANPWVVALTFTVEQRNIDAAPLAGAA